MKFDPKTRRYIDNGKVVHSSNVRKRVNQYIEHQQQKVSQLAADVTSGDLKLTSFFDQMAAWIREWHTYSGVVAYGGEDQMNQERWLRIDRKITDELTYLRQFENDMLQRTLNSEDMEVPGSLDSRAQMYADSAYSTYINNVSAGEYDAGVTLGRRVCEEDDASCEECVAASDTYYSNLADLPEIGTLTCLSNCRCYIEYAEPDQALTIDLLPADLQAQLSEAVQ